MQLKIHVSHDFNLLTVAEKILFSTHAVTEITAHATTFVTPNPPLADVTTATGNLAEANLAYLGNPDLHSAVVEAEKIWIKIMNGLADYVDGIADGSGAIIDISGFKQTKSESNPAVRPDVLVSDMYSGRSKGTAHIDNKTSVNAKAYINVLCSEDVLFSVNNNQITFTIGTSVVSLVIDTKRNADFTLLPSHKDMDGRSAAINSAGIGNFNNTVKVSIP